MPTPAIVIEHVGKRYAIGQRNAQGDGMRHAIERALRSPLSWLQSRSNTGTADFWALKDVSFEINRGDVVGIVGHNGAGKSTLLKTLSRITVPTEGRITINGRVASLLEVGTGFHPELTGRENIFLNGAILGMTRAEIVRRFDEIVEFADIGDFLDTPVKRYSSGMYVRLAFAVAAHLEPEILIVDEVLAVGDAAFQKKCLGKMGDFAQSGRTVLFVSHNMEAVRTLCHTGVWLKNGRLHRSGSATEIVEAYFNSISDDHAFSCSNAEYGFSIGKVSLKNAQGEPSSQFQPGDDLVVQVSYHAAKRISRPVLALSVLGMNGSCFTYNMLLDGYRPPFLEGSGTIVCTFRSIPLLPQSYRVKLIVRTENVRDVIIKFQEVAYFSVVGNLAKYGYKGDFLAYASQSTPVVVPYEWQLPDGTVAAVSLAQRSA